MNFIFQSSLTQAIYESNISVDEHFKMLTNSSICQQYNSKLNPGCSFWSVTLFLDSIGILLLHDLLPYAIVLGVFEVSVVTKTILSLAHHFSCLLIHHHFGLDGQIVCSGALVLYSTVAYRKQPSKYMHSFDSCLLKKNPISPPILTFNVFVFVFVFGCLSSHSPGLLALKAVPLLRFPCLTHG